MSHFTDLIKVLSAAAEADTQAIPKITDGAQIIPIPTVPVGHQHTISSDTKTKLCDALEEINQETYELDVNQEDLETIHARIVDLLNLISAIPTD